MVFLFLFKLLSFLVSFKLLFSIPTSYFVAQMIREDGKFKQPAFAKYRHFLAEMLRALPFPGTCFFHTDHKIQNNILQPFSLCASSTHYLVWGISAVTRAVLIQSIFCVGTFLPERHQVAVRQKGCRGLLLYETAEILRSCRYAAHCHG